MNSYNKPLGVICLMTFLCATAHAQLLDSTWALKINFGSIHLANPSWTSWSRTIPLEDGLSLNLVKETRNGNTQEWGLSHLRFGVKGALTDEFGRRARGKIIRGGLRYQYTWNFLKGPGKKTWEPYMGIGAFALVDYDSGVRFAPTSSSTTAISTSYRTWHYFAGVELVPGVKWNVGKRIFLDFSLPIQYMPVEWSRTRFNQVDGFNGRTNFTDYYDDVVRLGLRLGLGFKLGE